MSGQACMRRYLTFTKNKAGRLMDIRIPAFLFRGIRTFDTLILKNIKKSKIWLTNNIIYHIVLLSDNII